MEVSDRYGIYAQSIMTATRLGALRDKRTVLDMQREEDLRWREKILSRPARWREAK